MFKDYFFISCIQADLLCLDCMKFSRYKNHNVAIKIINKGDTPEEIAKIQGRFMREIAMLSKVKHKNLVKVSNVLIYRTNDLAF